MLSLLTLPARTALNRLNDPSFQAELQQLSALGLLRECWRAAAIVPAVVNCERQALGLNTSGLVIEDRRADLERERAWTDRALTNPKAVDLLVELLDEMAKPTTPTDGDIPPA